MVVYEDITDRQTDIFRFHTGGIDERSGMKFCDSSD